MEDRVRSACLAGSFIFAVSSVAEAQVVAPDAYLDTIAQAASRTWLQRIKPEFLAVADPETKRVLETVRVNIGRYADFNAFADGSADPPRILIPMGLVLGNEFVTSNTIFTYSHPECKKYFGPTLDGYKAAYVSLAKSGKAIDVRPVWSRCGFSDHDANRFFAEKEIYNWRVGIMVDALAAVVGHELGHIVKRHRAYSKISQKEAQRQENEADEFGFQLAKKAGFNPGAALITTYSFFVVLEGTRYKGKDHPPATCRYVELADKFVLNDENGPAKPPDKASVRKRENLLEELKPFREDCLSSKS